MGSNLLCRVDITEPPQVKLVCEEQDHAMLFAENMSTFEIAQEVFIKANGLACLHKNSD